MNNIVTLIIKILVLFALIVLSTETLANFKELTILNNSYYVSLLTLVFVLLILRESLVYNINKELKKKALGEQVKTKKKSIWFKNLIQKWTKSKDLEHSDEIILDHNYDGIKELDNVLPPWWVYLFYATIVFGVIYLARFGIMGGDSQITEYNKEMAQAKIDVEKYIANNPDALDISTVAQLDDSAEINKGKQLYAKNCVVCHLDDGGGLVGPNLTDEHWILGGGFKNVFNSIYNGGREGKGMEAWNKKFSAKKIQQLASYVMTLKGTTPKTPKAPEGEVWSESVSEEKK